MPQGVTLDFTKAEPIQPPVTLDFSKAQSVAEPTGAERERAHIQAVRSGGPDVAPVPHPVGEALAKGLIAGGVGAMAPELLPEISPVLDAVLGGAVGSGAAEATSKGVDASQGKEVSNSAEDIGKAMLIGGLTGGAMGLSSGWLQQLFGAKLSRGMINESVGATARDVTYGNPARALLDENITTPVTGDIEKYKDALRSGAEPQDALIASGGRLGEVAQKVKDLAPQLDKILGKSTATIKTADIIDKPLLGAATEIMSNPAVTDQEKDTAITQLGALQQSLKRGLGDTVSPLQANQIKQAIGNRINWTGNIAVSDDVKPAYRQVYGTIKEQVNKAVPEAADINERLTNLLSAQTDLERLAKAEEVGQGKGALGSAVTGIVRRAEAVTGRVIPGANAGAQAVQSAAPNIAAPTGASIADILKSKGITIPSVPAQQQQSPGLPFHPGEGISR